MDDDKAREMAGVLFDGGWRSDDTEQLMQEYELSEEDAEQISQWLELYEYNDQLEKIAGALFELGYRSSDYKTLAGIFYPSAVDMICGFLKDDEEVKE